MLITKESSSNKCDTVSTICNKCFNKHEVSNPDYVPPCDGGVNGKWCNNRHRLLTNDSNCYFLKGNKKDIQTK